MKISKKPMVVNTSARSQEHQRIVLEEARAILAAVYGPGCVHSDSKSAKDVVQEDRPQAATGDRGFTSARLKNWFPITGVEPGAEAATIHGGRRE